MLAALAGLAILAGCGSSTQNTATVADQNANPSAAQNQINPQPREKLQQGGKMTWAIDQAVPNFNYNELDGPSIGEWILSAVVPEIFVFDARATPTYNPNYLTGEPELMPGPPQVVKYELNPKAIWFDGTPINAADYIAQWKALSGKDRPFIASSSGYDHIKESVTQGANRFEVIVTFATPYAD